MVLGSWLLARVARGFGTRVGFALPLATAFGLSGCSDTPDLGGTSAGSDSGGESSGDTTGDVELVIAEVVATHCEFVDACNCAGDISTDCDGTLSLKWEARLEAGVEQALTLDAACLDATLARLQAQECRWPASSLGQVCASFCAVYHGDLQLGEACTAYDVQVSDCGQGLACSAGVCTEPCAALGGALAGDACRSDEFGEQFEECVQDLQCDWESQACMVLPGIGQSCDSQNCRDGLWCDWDAQICRAGAVAGESCQEADCAEDLYCNWNDESPVCRTYVGAGGSCAQAQCADGLFCNNASQCIAPPGPGVSCANGQCASGATCDWNADQCVALPEAGQTCVFSECAGTAWCDFSDPDEPEGRCASLTDYGQACSGHSQCATAYCPAGYCDHRPEGGEACSANLPCANGLACNGDTCIATRSLGSAVCIYNGW